jgi:hypothetical protein
MSTCVRFGFAAFALALASTLKKLKGVLLGLGEPKSLALDEAVCANTRNLLAAVGV